MLSWIYAYVTDACMFEHPMASDVFSTSHFAYVTITIMRKASAMLWLFQQCASDVIDLAYVTGSVPQDGSTLNPILHVFLYNYTVINCLLLVFVYDYYVQPMYYTYLSWYCESLTDWSIPLKPRHTPVYANHPSFINNDFSQLMQIMTAPKLPLWRCSFSDVVICGLVPVFKLCRRRLEGESLSHHIWYLVIIRLT